MAPLPGRPAPAVRTICTWAGPRRVVRHGLGQRHHQPVVLPGCLFVHGLVEIVRRSVVTLGEPLLRHLLLLRTLLVTEGHHQRGNATANEAVLVAADEDVSLRL